MCGRVCVCMCVCVCVDVLCCYTYHVHTNLVPLLFFDQVTDAGMEEIGTQCTQLTQLSLAECDNVQVRRVQDLGTMTQKIV